MQSCAALTPVLYVLDTLDAPPRSWSPAELQAAYTDACTAIHAPATVACLEACPAQVQATAAGLATRVGALCPCPSVSSLRVLHQPTQPSPPLLRRCPRQRALFERARDGAPYKRNWEKLAFRAQMLLKQKRLITLP